MMKFFRKIRQRLLTESKFSKYLLYAIGEIILVVIGILIALQINNWNEDHRDKKKVRIALKSLHEELVADSLEINNIIKNVRNEASHNQRLLLRAYDETATLDTLIKIVRDEFSALWVAHLKYSRSTYDNLKSAGSYEILPDTIKLALSDFYATQDYWINVIAKTNLQYQNKYDDFTKTYNLDGSRASKNINAFVYNSTWKHIDSKHFVPRAISMMGAKNILWKNFHEELEIVQRKTRDLIKLIKPHMF
ncbi:MAG: hypothetical protein DHS20C18_35560 [Saprospiraceae bacterium]|nr:MAG: hypothetical protein DHS20C18_35560 [Saprospiraceae bacterium]